MSERLLPFVPPTFAPGCEPSYEDVRELYSRLCAIERNTKTHQVTAATLMGDMKGVHFNIVEAIFENLIGYLAEQTFYRPMSKFPAFDSNSSPAKRAELMCLLLEKEFYLEHMKEIDLWVHDRLSTAFDGMSNRHPVEGTGPFNVPLIETMREPNALVQQIVDCHSGLDTLGPRVFADINFQIFVNMRAAAGYSARGSLIEKEKWLEPRDSDLSPTDLVSAYLKDTFYEPILLAKVPIAFTRKQRFSHTHILGGTGAGKTSLIERLILCDLVEDLNDPPSIVLIDPHSDLVRKLLNAPIPHRNRLIHIDPRDISHPPALNIFALNRERMANYDAVTREQVTASVIDTFDYLFTGLTDLALTGKQETFFRYVARLMLALPETMGRNATILDMMRLMADATPYRAAIDSLPEIQREFFTVDFNTKIFAQTKEQIRYRLQNILSNPTLARLFTAPETKLDLFTELNRGSIILIDTAQDFLKGGSAVFGKLMVSLILQAISERAAIPEKDRKDTFIYIDEAADLFSDNIDTLLTDARKFKAGLILAHQYLDQASQGLRASLAANTANKFVSGVSAGDASAMAREMRTSADFITKRKQLEFAAYYRNVTPHAVPVSVKPFNWPAMVPERAMQDFIGGNRMRVSLGASEFDRPASTPRTPSPVKPDEDASYKW